MDLDELGFDNEDLKSFIWDKGNENKNWLKHKVTKEESEQIFLNKPVVFLDDKVHSKNEIRYGVFGRTDKNRFLTAFFTIRKKQIRIISVRNQTKTEISLYIKYINWNKI